MNPYYSRTNPFSLDARVAVNSVESGNQWMSRGELKKAIDDFSEAIRRDPRVAIAYRSRGDAWSRIGEYDKAISDFDEFLRLKPDAADGYYARGSAWGAERQFGQGCHRSGTGDPARARSCQVPTLSVEKRGFKRAN